MIIQTYDIWTIYYGYLYFKYLRLFTQQFKIKQTYFDSKKIWKINVFLVKNYV